MQQKWYCYEVQRDLWRMLNTVLIFIDLLQLKSGFEETK